MFGLGHKKEEVAASTPAVEAPEASQAQWDSFAASADAAKEVTEPKVGDPGGTREGLDESDKTGVTHDLGGTALGAEVDTESLGPLAELPAVVSPEVPAQEQPQPEQNTAA